jgi:hypothetical protein
MKRMAAFVSIGVFIVASAFAQGRGGSGGAQRGGQGSGQRQVQGQGQGIDQGQWQGQQQGGSQAGNTQMRQERIKTTKQQREQMHTCSKQADSLRKQIRTMARTSDKKFNGDEARRQRDRIKNQLQAMEQEHERLMNGLDPSQQLAFKEHIQNMNRLRKETHSGLQSMNSELDPANPNASRVKERARGMEQIMEEWTKEYQTLHSQTRD